jgi:hypothetical protein
MRVEPTLNPAPTAVRHSGGDFASVLREAARRLDTLEAAPGRFDDQLQLQATLYRQAFVVELTARLLDQAIAAAKTLLQSRVS